MKQFFPAAPPPIFRLSELCQRISQAASHLQSTGRIRDIEHLLIVPQLQPVKAGQLEVRSEQIMHGELVR